MRVSTDTLYRQGVASMLDQQARLLKVQKQLATGEKNATAADDPAAVSGALDLDTRLAALDRYKQNTDAARHRLNVEESTLSGATDTLQRVRELLVQANGGGQTDSSRRMIAAELRQRRAELIGLANTDDGSGHYIFGGSQDGSAPFATTGAGVSYAGDQTARLIAIAPGRDIADGDPGSEVFQRVPTGNGLYRVSGGSNTGTASLQQARTTNASLWDGDTYTVTFLAGGNYEVRNSATTLVASGTYTAGSAISFAGIDLTFSGTPAAGDTFTAAPGATQDMFATLQDAIDDLETPRPDGTARADLQTRLFNGLQDLDRALDHVQEVRAGVGARLSALDDSDTAHDALGEQLQEARSGLRDVDYAEAVSRMQQLLTAMQAAQQSFLKVQGLSLFDLLR